MNLGEAPASIGGAMTHAKIIIRPDGGVSRVRIYSTIDGVNAVEKMGEIYE